MDLTVPRQHGRISIRLVKQRDAKTLQNELLSNRSWLRPWEATLPQADEAVPATFGGMVRTFRREAAAGRSVAPVPESNGRRCVLRRVRERGRDCGCRG